MSKNSYKQIFLLILIIIFIKGKDNEEELLNNLEEQIISNITNPNEFYDSKNILKLLQNENESLSLNYSHNIIDFNNDIKYYYLNTTIDIKGKELLIFTNLTNKLIYIDNKENKTIPMFYNISEIKQTLLFQINALNETGTGFIDFLLINEREFEINQNIIREDFYNNSIFIKKGNCNFDTKYYINFIPNDNNSDAYYLQFSNKEDKEKINLYYINKINYDTIDGIIKDIKAHPMKRDKKINGKIEILAFEYNNFSSEEIKIKLDYNRIRGEGISGFILTLSVLFFILMILVFIFFKNAYCSKIINTPNNQEQEDEYDTSKFD